MVYTNVGFKVQPGKHIFTISLGVDHKGKRYRNIKKGQHF